MNFIRMGLCCFLMFFLAVVCFAEFPQPSIKWSIPVQVNLAAAPIPYPLNNPDGVIVGTSGHVIRIDGKGKVIFETRFGPETSHGSYHYNVSLVDLDGDGNDEIICGAYDGYLYAMNANDGSIRWEYNLGTKLGMFRYATPADLTGDGKPEILAPNMDGWLSCLSHEGKLLWRFKSERYRISTASVGDINNDGRLEIVFGTSTHHIIALNEDGSLLWDRFYDQLDFSRSKPMIVDTDGDGSVEIYTMSCRRVQNQGLISLTGNDGSLRWLAPMTHKAYYSLVAADLDQDGVKELIVADKRTAVAAFSSDGKLLWRTFLSGRGIWTAPAVGDLDGDGLYEIILTTRGKSRDGKDYSWYVLNTAGKILAGFPLQGEGFGAPLVADIDQDGFLEVVLASENPGRVTAFNFGGSVTPKAVLSAFERQLDYPLPKPERVITSQAKYPMISFLSKLPMPRYGDNPLDFTLPRFVHPAVVEVKTVAPDQSVHLQCFPVTPESRTARLSWSVLLPGNYSLSLRLLETQTGRTVGQQIFSQKILDPLKPVKNRLDNVIKKLDIKKNDLAEVEPEATAFITHLQTKLESQFKILEILSSKSVSFDIIGREALKMKVDEYLWDCARSLELAALAAAKSTKPQVPFLLWQDMNPWDNINPLDELPDHRLPLTMSTWAFGNEVESVCANIVNLSPDNLTLRIDPGILAGDKPQPTHHFVELFRPVELPGSKGEMIPDLLVSCDPGYIIDLAPAQAKQIWFNIKTKDLEPGRYLFSWKIRTLDTQSASTDIQIEVDVSKIRLAEKSSFAANFWSQNQLGDIETISDLNDHLQTVWTRIPLPSAQADEQGEIVGELDWQQHDQIVLKIIQIEKILYNSPVVPRLPDGVAMTPELKLTAQKNYAHEMMKHLRQLGLDYQDFAFYPQDEPGLVGGVDDYVELARNIKAIDPNFLVYANPAEGITIDMIEQMYEVTDVWQPDMGSIAALGKPYLDAMRKGNKPVWTFTPPGWARITSPLGFYRALSWIAYYWDLQGAGYWVYHSDDLWATRPEYEPDYGSVAFDGRALLPSRRWEATRDGIEDYNMLCLLRDKLKAKSYTEIQNLLEEAVDYVAQRAIISVPIPAADYELDFPKFQNYRKEIRAALEKLFDQ